MTLSMNENNFTVKKLETSSSESKKYRPVYKVTEENLIQLLDYYFPNLMRGDMDSFLKSMIRTNINLNELEYYAEQIYPFLRVIREMLEKIPTQINILDYALEIFLDTDWDRSEKEIERIKIIEDLREYKNDVLKYNHSKEYHSVNDISYYIIDQAFFDIGYSDEQDYEESRGAGSDYYDDEYEGPDWTESEYYDDDLEWNEQGGDFWDDVI
jgi:hypothetical protein